MIKRLIALNIFILLFCGTPLAAEEVYVGGYLSPPFIEKDKQGKISGITPDLIHSLNKIQQQYHFKLILTSARRRYLFFKQGQFDMIFFERILWGWQNKPLVAIKLPLKGGDVFIALKSTASNQEYFDNIKDKSIAATLGYHYSFAGFNSDPEFLRNNFNIHLSTNENINIQLVLLEKMSVGIVTKSSLDKYLFDNPSTKNKLLMSNKWDQEYTQTILLRNDIKPNVADIKKLVDKLVESGEYNKIMRRYGIEH